MSCTFSPERIQETISFHGHSCPGLAIGIRAAELALRDLGDPQEIDMVVIAETDMCGVDAIQYLTGCTYGKGNFLHRDYGKMAFSFYNGITGKGIRALFDSAHLSDISAPEEEKTDDLRSAAKDKIMSLSLDTLFTTTPLEEGLPRPAVILENLVCEVCGESVMESRTRRFAGKTLCIPCFAAVEQKL